MDLYQNPSKSKRHQSRNTTLRNHPFVLLPATSHVLPKHSSDHWRPNPEPGSQSLCTASSVASEAECGRGWVWSDACKESSYIVVRTVSMDCLFVCLSPGQRTEVFHGRRSSSAARRGPPDGRGHRAFRHASAEAGANGVFGASE